MFQGFYKFSSQAATNDCSSSLISLPDFSFVMLPSERFSLPYPALLVSIIFSATCMGLMIPYARDLPLVFGSILFTLIYHSLFLLSAFVNENPERWPRLYISPLDHPHTVWIFVIATFWLAASIHCDVQAALSLGNTSDADICLDILTSLEFFLTTYIAYLCGKELRKQSARQKTNTDKAIESIISFRQDFFFFFDLFDPYSGGS